MTTPYIYGFISLPTRESIFVCLRYYAKEYKVIKILHLKYQNDHGTKLKNEKFQILCRSNDVNHSFSSPRIHPQNGLVIRKKHNSSRDDENHVL